MTCPFCHDSTWVTIPDPGITERDAMGIITKKTMVFLHTICVPCPECQPDGGFIKNKDGTTKLAHQPFSFYLESDRSQYVRLLSTYLFLWLRVNRPGMEREVFESGRFGLSIDNVDRAACDSYTVMSESDHRKASQGVAGMIARNISKTEIPF